MAVPLLAVGLWFVGGSLPALAGSPTDVGGEEESLQNALGRVVCLVDSSGFIWNLNVGGGSIAGSVNTDVGALCAATYSVSGTHVRLSLTAMASDPIPPDNCCGGFTYTGVADKPSRTASGTWTNICGGEGFFPMGLC